MIDTRECRSCHSAPYPYRTNQYLPYDPERKGVPVTRFTAAPGMLVRRGYDVREGEEREAAAGEVRCWGSEVDGRTRSSVDMHWAMKPAAPELLVIQLCC